MNKRLSSAALIAALLVTSVAGALSTGPDVTITWKVVNTGGGDSYGGVATIRGTIGQHDAGTMSGGVYEINGGFWTAARAVPTCPGDVDGNAIVDFDDLIAVLAAWGVCPDCPADLNDDGFVDFEDLLLVLSNYGPCP